MVVCCLGRAWYLCFVANQNDMANCVINYPIAGNIIQPAYIKSKYCIDYYDNIFRFHDLSK